MISTLFFHLASKYFHNIFIPTPNWNVIIEYWAGAGTRAATDGLFSSEPEAAKAFCWEPTRGRWKQDDYGSERSVSKLKSSIGR